MAFTIEQIVNTTSAGTAYTVAASEKVTLKQLIARITSTASAGTFTITVSGVLVFTMSPPASAGLIALAQLGQNPSFDVTSGSWNEAFSGIYNHTMDETDTIVIAATNCTFTLSASGVRES